MNGNLGIKLFALALATVVVGGGMTALASYSNAKNATAIAAANGTRDSGNAYAVAAPMKIDVVGKRSARTAA